MSDCLVERRADQREAPNYKHLPLSSAGNSELQISSSQLPALARRGAEFSSVSRVSDRERLLQIRREEIKSQHHDQIWTKLAHGGPYRKVRLLQTPHPCLQALTDCANYLFILAARYLAK